MSGKTKYIYGEIRHETKGAYLIAFDHDCECWLPKSQITIDVKNYNVDVPDWLIKQKEIPDKCKAVVLFDKLDEMDNTKPDMNDPENPYDDYDEDCF